MQYNTILLESINYIYTIKLNRPEKRNAISKQLLSELEDCLTELQSSGARVLILTGVGESFCAGADLKERMGMTEPEIISFLDSFRRTLDRLEQLSFPTIAAFNGDAFGGGLEIALACDFRYMSTNAKIGLTETKLGIIPGAGGTQRLSRLIGTSKAKEMIFAGKRVGYEKAFQDGLINGYAEPSSLSEYVNSIAREIASSSPLSVKLSKQSMEGVFMSLNEGLDLERKLYLQTLSSRDRLEGLKAFQEKRQPIFTGE